VVKICPYVIESVADNVRVCDKPTFVWRDPETQLDAGTPWPESAHLWQSHWAAIGGYITHCIILTTHFSLK
jgi:hypothetical protein